MEKAAKLSFVSRTEKTARRSAWRRWRRSIWRPKLCLALVLSFTPPLSHSSTLSLTHSLSLSLCFPFATQTPLRQMHRRNSLARGYHERLGPSLVDQTSRSLSATSTFVAEPTVYRALFPKPPFTETRIQNIHRHHVPVITKPARTRTNDRLVHLSAESRDDSVGASHGFSGH